MKKLSYSLFLFAVLTGFFAGPAAIATKHTVQVGNFFFSPATLTVAVGDTVKWVWMAGSHTTTSTPGAIPAGAAAWDELINSANQTYEYKVTVAGSYSYVCTPHVPGMVASFNATGFTPTLSVAPSNRNVVSSAGTTTFTVTSNTSWTVSSNASWCTVTPSGTGNGTINANFTENLSVSQRMATLSVAVSGLPVQTVTVTQSGAAPILSVSPSNQNVAATPGTTSFSVTSNTSWSATSDAAWCTVTPSGTGNGTLTATFAANATFATRTATISVTVSGLSPQPVTVVQAASTVGIGSPVTEKLQVSPNPSKGRFRILALPDAGETTVTLSEISGKTISRERIADIREHIFDLSGHPAGIYFIRIDFAGSTEVRRIIITE